MYVNVSKRGADESIMALMIPTLFVCVCVCVCVRAQQGVTRRCVASLTLRPTPRLPLSCWIATPAPPTSPPGSSPVGAAYLG